MSTSDGLPPMDPHTDEASPEQLDAARAQGEAYGSALQLMTSGVAEDGGEQRAGDYLVGYAVEEAEGLYEWSGSGVQWRDPATENVHLEVSVRDAADGRFVPGARVTATLSHQTHGHVGTYYLPLLWHPMLYHYGANCTVPEDGTYRLEVVVDPPEFARHDRVNGRRFCASARAEFSDVRIEPGRS